MAGKRVVFGYLGVIRMERWVCGMESYPLYSRCSAHACRMITGEHFRVARRREMEKVYKKKKFSYKGCQVKS